MSTRSQVKVIQNGIGWKEEVTLYHHTDGYPEYMIPTILKASNYTRLNYKGEVNNCKFEKGRAGKTASLLCWADPGVFEPEEGHGLHGDIEYYYKLYVNGSRKWEIEIFDPDYSGTEGFPIGPDENKMKPHTQRTPLEELIKKYPVDQAPGV